MIINENTKNEKGITLIALVITIIVLLILAAVSIAMLTGENGILKKVSTASERTLEAEAEEKIKLAVLGARDNDGNFNKNLLNEELKKYGLNGETTESGTTVKANGKTYTIDDKGTVTSKDSTENNVTAKMIADNPSKYYGKKVTNYTSTNGQNDWKILYSDGTHIFLITGDYVTLSTDEKLNSNTKMTKTGTNYSCRWDTVPDLQSTDNTVLNRFMETKYTPDNSQANSKCVSTLLNANNWENYKDSNGMAEYAIGGSTIEMWIASWNNLYKNIDGQLFCNVGNYGYCIAENETTTDDFLSPVQMDSKKGYSNPLYYPHTSYISDDNYIYTNYYLLASPHIGSSNLLCVDCYGGVTGYTYDNHFAIRPVVSLNTSASVNITD